jgi:16S rRNA A1518/A1519 N6-dimethyltransferase RsmA/KsgA/DIM1 with predicted DNA glycosylase/AP lyase activity
MQYTLKKSLGQHFLKDESICKMIVAALQEDPCESDWWKWARAVVH